MKNISKSTQIIIIVIAVIVAAILLSLVTVIVLRVVTPQKSGTTSADTSNVSSLQKNAATAENAGNTKKAIDEYKKLLSSYKETGDQMRVADAEAKIKQLEKIQHNDATALQDNEKDAKARAEVAGAPYPDPQN